MNRYIPDADGGHSALDARGEVDEEPETEQVTPEVAKWIVDYYRDLVRVANDGKFRGHYGPFLGAGMRYHAALYHLRHPYQLDRLRDEEPDYLKHLSPKEFVACTREIGREAHPDLVKAFDNLPESAEGWMGGDQTAIQMTDPSTTLGEERQAPGGGQGPPQPGGIQDTSLMDLLARPIGEVVNTLLTLKSLENGRSREELEREVLGAFTALDVREDDASPA